MNLSDYKTLKAEIDNRLDIAEVILKENTTVGNMGLAIRTEEYKKANNSFHLIYNELKQLNKFANKNLKKELKEDRLLNRKNR